MTCAYEKLMEREGLTIKDLPTDARLGIEAINNIAKAIKRAELSKQEVSEKTWTKLRQMINGYAMKYLISLKILTTTQTNCHTKKKKLLTK